MPSVFKNDSCDIRGGMAQWTLTLEAGCPSASLFFAKLVKCIGAYTLTTTSAKGPSRETTGYAV